ncbi:MAG: NAD(+) synthase [Oscillospiraceae bacterium]|jgi:NAD+ synthase (glutamine-hydrolysing)|nr:NAD(+) synthase [Oscillospiraceae bacterium]
MHKDFFRVAALSVEARPGYPAENVKQILDALRRTEGAGLVVFPELTLTGDCGSLLLRDDLLDAAEDALASLLPSLTAPLTAVGLPVRIQDGVYSCAAIAGEGKLLGVVPGSRPARFLRGGANQSGAVTLCGQTVMCGTDLLFDGGGLCAAFVLGGDPLYAPCPDGAYIRHGANVLGHLGTAWEKRRLRDTLAVQSARLRCAYVSAGSSESFAAENGVMLAKGTDAVTEFDIGLLRFERRGQAESHSDQAFFRVPFTRPGPPPSLLRTYSRDPFAAEGDDALADQCRALFGALVKALRTRLERLPDPGAAVAVSGGLDSALALLVAVNAAAPIGRTVLAVTMPGPGSSERTRNNAKALCGALGVPLGTVPITDAVAAHLAAIGHDGSPDSVYENAQARERARTIFDMANAAGCIVVGPSDLTEAALGFTTFAGDSMSMLGVNAGLPKTMIRHIAAYFASLEDHPAKNALRDILDTPVSPELLPLDAFGEQRQKSEELLGDYILHDFFLYWFLRHGYSREKLLIAAKRAFAGRYGGEVLETALETFLTRFVRSQYKRSAAPEGVTLGEVSLDVCDWSMPGDMDQWPG